MYVCTYVRIIVHPTPAHLPNHAHNRIPEKVNDYGAVRVAFMYMALKRDVKKIDEFNLFSCVGGGGRVWDAEKRMSYVVQIPDSYPAVKNRNAIYRIKSNRTESYLVVTKRVVGCMGGSRYVEG